MPRPARRPDSKSRIKVLVVDDRQLLAEALGFVLRADRGFELVGIQIDIGELRADVARLVPDVVVLDYVTLIRGAGSAIVRSLRAEFPAVRVLVVTQSQDEETLLSCVQAGAAGFVTKDLPLAELGRSIRRVHAGDTLFAAGPLADLLRRTQPPPPKAPKPDFQPLGVRELEVLRILATGLSTEETARQLGISVHTLRTHLKNLMGKLGVHSKLEAVIFAIRERLIDPPGSAPDEISRS